MERRQSLVLPLEPSIAIDIQGRGEPVLLLHGIGGNRSNWSDQLPALAERYRAIAWDARGYGGSGDGPEKLDFQDFGDDLIAVLDHLEVPTAHLIGLSMGGRIAIDVAQRFPSRVRSLVLADTHPGFDGFTEEMKAAFVFNRKAPLLAGKEPSDIAPDLARAIAGRAATPATRERLIESISALRKEPYIEAVEAFVMSDPSRPLEGITCPTLVVVGEDDRLTPIAMARTIQERIEGAELVIIPEAGHLANLERPEEFNRAVLDFLRRLDREE